MNKKGADLWMYIVGIIVALVLLAVLLLAVPSVRKGFLGFEELGPSDYEQGLSKCRSACESAKTMAETCEQYTNIYCNSAYNSSTTCGAADVTNCVVSAGNQLCGC